MSEQTPISTESNVSPIQESQSNNNINLNESIAQSPSIDGEDQSLRITIKFLNETQKSIVANPNDTISKLKR
jgi:hypothetical protein